MEKKTRGGFRENSGRKPGSGTGRNPGKLIRFNAEQTEWIDAQPDGPQDYIRRLVDEDKAKREAI